MARKILLVLFAMMILSILSVSANIITGGVVISPVCSDSEKGATTENAGVVSYGNQRYADSCAGKTRVLELSCSSARLPPLRQNLACRAGTTCVGGACPAPLKISNTTIVSPRTTPPYVPPRYVPQRITGMQSKNSLPFSAAGLTVSNGVIDYPPSAKIISAGTAPSTYGNNCPPDSDSNWGVYFPSNATGVISSAGSPSVKKTFPDYCIDNMTLNEVWCNRAFGFVTSTKILCMNGCKTFGEYGACIKYAPAPVPVPAPAPVPVPVPAPVPSPLPTPTGCTDSDGDSGVAPNLYVRGKAVGLPMSDWEIGSVYGENANLCSDRIEPDFKGVVRYDCCLDKMNLAEAVCKYKSGTPPVAYWATADKISCTFGCSEGVCLKEAPAPVPVPQPVPIPQPVPSPTSLNKTPNMAIGNIVITPRTGYYVGDVIDYYSHITNPGFGDAPATQAVIKITPAQKKDGELYSGASFAIPALRGQYTGGYGSYKYSGYFTIVAPGEITISAQADSTNVVINEPEDDNSASYSFKVYAAPTPAPVPTPVCTPTTWTPSVNVNDCACGKKVIQTSNCGTKKEVRCVPTGWK